MPPITLAIHMGVNMKMNMNMKDEVIPVFTVAYG